MLAHATTRAPFPWYGSKAAIAGEVWGRFGSPGHYIEPFCGSAAVLLSRPNWQPGQLETVNDIDGLLVNAYRAIRSEPSQVARWADWPISEVDMASRQHWLVQARQRLVSLLQADPAYYDAKAAGWWLWGLACWVGDAWCSGRGTLIVQADSDGLPVAVRQDRAVEGGVVPKAVHLTGPQGIKRTQGHSLESWFASLAERLSEVRITCGDWERVLSARHAHVDHVDRSPVAVFLDPPYATARRVRYAHDGADVAREVREWCLHRAPKDWRVALCGLAGEHDELGNAGWDALAWNDDTDGWGLQRGSGSNRAKEKIWFSPACQGPAQGSLW